MGTKVIFLLIVCTVWLTITNAESCVDEFNDFKSCVRSQMTKDRDDPNASDNRRQKMRSDFTSCAVQNGCQDPYPPDSERQAREYCFGQARDTVREKLQQCVRQSYRNFDLPQDDNDKDAYWNFLLLRSFAAMRSLGDNRYNKNRGNKKNWDRAAGNQQQNDICGNNDDKKNRVVVCVRDRGVFNKTSANSNWRKNTCRIRRECNQVSRQCQDEWDNNHKPKLCDCVSQIRNNGLKQIQDDYVQCIRRRGVRISEQNQNDDGRKVVAKMLISWCASGKVNKTQLNQTDPCRRGRGRGNGNNNGRGQGNNNNGRGNNGRGNGGNSGNEGENWNGNTQNGNNWNGNSQSGNNWNSQSGNNGNSGDSGFDDGTPAQAVNTDSPYEEFWGGDPVISQSVSGSSNVETGSSNTGGGFGSLLGNSGGLGGGLLNGGGLGGLGNGGFGGGALSSFTGGGGGGPLSALTGGGGGPLSAFTGGGGGGGPLSALTGGGGGGLTDLLGGFGGGLGGFAPAAGGLGGGTGILDSMGGIGSVMGSMPSLSPF